MGESTTRRLEVSYYIINSMEIEEKILIDVNTLEVDIVVVLHNISQAVVLF